MVQLTIDFTLGCTEQTWAEAQICLAQAVTGLQILLRLCLPRNPPTRPGGKKKG